MKKGWEISLFSFLWVAWIGLGASIGNWRGFLFIFFGFTFFFDWQFGFLTFFLTGFILACHGSPPFGMIDTIIIVYFFNRSAVLQRFSSDSSAVMSVGIRAEQPPKPPVSFLHYSDMLSVKTDEGTAVKELISAIYSLRRFAMVWLCHGAHFRWDTLTRGVWVERTFKTDAHPLSADFADPDDDPLLFAWVHPAQAGSRTAAR